MTDKTEETKYNIIYIFCGNKARYEQRSKE